MQRSESVYLPRAQVLLCLKPGKELTDHEIELLEEYFIALQAAREAGGGSANQDSAVQ